MKSKIAIMIFLFIFAVNCNFDFKKSDDSRKDDESIFLQKPKIAFNTSGNAIVVWSQYNETESVVYSNTYSGSSGWNNASMIETIENVHEIKPEIAIDSSGNAIVVWSQFEEDNSSIHSKRFIPGTGWEDSAIIESGNTNFNNPKIKFDSSDNAIVIWHQSDDDNKGIYAKRYVNGRGWDDSEKIETINAENMYEPQLSTDSSNNAIVVWGIYDGIRCNIYSKYYSSADGWESAVSIKGNSSMSEFDPHAAFDTSGNPFIVWRQYDGKNYRIAAKKFDNNSESVLPEIISIEGAGYSFFPKIAVDGNDNVIVVWHQRNKKTKKVYVNRYSSSESNWQGPEWLAASDDEMTFYPDISVDDSGNAIVVWNQNDNSILSRRYDVNSNTWEEPLEISILE